MQGAAARTKLATESMMVSDGGSDGDRDNDGDGDGDGDSDGGGASDSDGASTQSTKTGGEVLTPARTFGPV